MCTSGCYVCQLLQLLAAGHGCSTCGGKMQKGPLGPLCRSQVLLELAEHLVKGFVREVVAPGLVLVLGHHAQGKYALVGVAGGG